MPLFKRIQNVCNIIRNRYFSADIHNTFQLLTASIRINSVSFPNYDNILIFVEQAPICHFTLVSVKRSEKKRLSFTILTFLQSYDFDIFSVGSNNLAVIFWYDQKKVLFFFFCFLLIYNIILLLLIFIRCFRCDE